MVRQLGQWGQRLQRRGGQTSVLVGLISPMYDGPVPRRRKLYLESLTITIGMYDCSHVAGH